jgi:hypothetical protein
MGTVVYRLIKEYRVIIKLNSLKSNYDMLINIVKVIGRKC